MLITNRYEIHEELGRGGMGAVYRATDRLTGQPVALKRVHVAPKNLMFNSQDNSEPHLSLAREFQVLASLRHPNIISVQDYGFDENLQPYFTMSFFEHPQTLRNIQVSVRERIRLVIDVLEALAYLHRREILHRDLKPSNVVVAHGQAFLLDFGLAMDPRLRSNKGVAGTLSYIPPEIFNNYESTPASDLYSVGVMLYELIAGRRPFESDSISDLVMAVLNQPPDLRPIDSVDMELIPEDVLEADDDPTIVMDPASIPTVARITNRPSQLAARERLTEIIGRLLEKDPALRYQDARSVIVALSETIGEPVVAESQAVRESFLQAASFVGRYVELAQLSADLLQAVNGFGRVWLVSGESGVGKSRLLDELRSYALVWGAEVIRGQVTNHHGGTFSMWGNIAAQLVLSVEVSDLEASILKAIVPTIGDLLRRDVPDAPDIALGAIKERIIQTIIDLFRRNSQPVLLLLEDLHEADESLLLLQALVDAIDNLKLMVVASYRQTEQHDFAKDLPDVPNMRLERLDKGNIQALVSSILGEAVGERTDLIDFLENETKGNVFFAVEVIRALAEEAGSLAEIRNKELPSHLFDRKLEAIFRRRLKNVPQMIYSVLYLAAVGGRRIDLKVMQHAVRQLPLESVNAVNLTPETLEEWFFICANAAVLEQKEGIWRFTHEQLRQMLIDQLSPTELINHHAYIGDAIETVHSNRLSIFSTVLFHHWHAANDHLKAIPYLLKAAQHMISTSGAFEEANALLEDHIALVNQHGSMSQKIEALQLLGDTSEMLGDYDRAENYLNQCIVLANQENAPLPSAKARGGLGFVAFRRGHYAKARDIFQANIVFYENNHEPLQWANTLVNLGNITFAEGDRQQASDYYRHANKLYNEINYQYGIAHTWNNLGIIQMNVGDYEEAKAYLQNSLVAYREVGYRYGAASCLNNLGLLAKNQGNYLEASLNLKESYKLYKAINHLHGVAVAAEGLGTTERLLGNYTKAKSYFSESLSVRRKLDDQRSIGLALINLAGITLSLGDYEQSIKQLTEAINLLTEVNHQRGTIVALSVRGDAYYRHANFAEARRDLQASLELNQQIGNGVGVARNHYLLGMVALGQENFQEALAQMEKALQLQEDAEDGAGLAQTLAGLTRLWLALDKPAKAQEALSRAVQLALALAIDGLSLHVLGVGIGWAYQEDKQAQIEEWLLLVLSHSATEAVDKTNVRNMQEKIQQALPEKMVAPEKLTIAQALEQLQEKLVG